MPIEPTVLHVPVLVVGAGPTGLAAAVALARVGVDSLTVDRRRGPSPYPRSTGISARTMQIFRRWAIDDRIRAGAIPVPARVFLAASLGGEPIQGPLPFGIVEEPAADPFSPIGGLLAAQDHMEPVMLEACAASDRCDVRYATELVDLDVGRDGVRATLRDRDGGAEQIVQAHYLIAADGAHSAIREQLEIGIYGPGHIATYRSMLFRAPALHDHLGDGAGALHILAGPPYPGGGFIRQGVDRWVFWYPIPDGERETYPDERCVAVIREAAALPDLSVGVEKTICFDLAIHVAERFRSGRVFLAGDAAHRMTPTGAMGANTAIHDIVNLAWKLAGVLQGWADPALLDSYELERQPVAERNAMRSLDVGHFLAHADLAIDLGYVSVSDAIVAEGDEPDPTVLEPYEPSAAPGRLAPHGWISVDGTRMSTVDLFDDAFVLLTTDPAWKGAIGASAAPLRVVVADDGDGLGELYGIGASGAALVRPDGVVAWRTELDADAGAAPLAAALRRALGYGPHPERDRPWAGSKQELGAAMEREATAALESVPVHYI